VNALDLPNVLRPISVGTLSLDHRLVVPPHGGGNGNLLGSDAEFEQHCALWLAKARGGMQWLGGGPNFVKNPLPVGFEATGVGSHGPGFFRDRRYPARLAEFARRLHEAGAFVSVQMVQQGGMPTAPSATFSGYADHRIAHALDRDEVRWLVREYGESAAIAIDAGVDAIEIHANHDDVVQWFLSPATNLRTDEYGGSFENRRRFLREIAESIRSLARRPFTFGLRLNLDEMVEGGYRIDECQRLVEAFTADGTVDYFSFDVGGNWDAPSYIPIPWYEDVQWAELCGQAKQATNLPVVYAGRATSPEQAEAVLAAGHADLVAMARATMTDPALANKALGHDPLPLRPCIGLNECIHRKLVDGLSYACGVSTTFAREHELAGRPLRTTSPQTVVVVGGGPGGTEFAALCAEQGHSVQLWERSDALGGAIAVAALARGNAKYARWIAWQTDRVARAGVEVHLERVATAADVMSVGAGVVLIATGSTPRRPPISGADAAHVFTAAGALQEPAALGHRIVVISEDDGPAPLSVADHLAGLGHAVTLVYQTTAPSPLVGKYSNGGMLARLIDGGVEFVGMARATEISGQTVHLASTYGTRRWTIGPFDSVILATGSIPNDSLYRELKALRPNVHILGDAFAPRRMVFATRQAFDLAQTLLTPPT
jgi:2,4-dienoyl-CoA reductase-like NADH-dependent reductase (Old Yellow Enzyme family)/NADPH-dependent 2,4-dienoyl-CoA reductase/sulfur reductase-like enzyme